MFNRIFSSEKQQKRKIIKLCEDIFPLNENKKETGFPIFWDFSLRFFSFSFFDFFVDFLQIFSSIFWIFFFFFC